ncbi:DUF1127 domain-containing protein [Amaricoccus sp.]|uniref:DUF1127 domain-containing protein n=1 Tax=Amaricoccus sp. TaxID=1872485 RepID=UPI0026332E2F|nr:DUF1127 domain-containing protein [Amaricoccus sp.]HRO10292.1 DUF1127 domain-containing protein [Amaricoccus sp.]
MTTAIAVRTARPVLAAGERRNDGIASRLARVWREFRSYRLTLADLQQLTDRQLTDVGLTRGVLKETAHRAVYGR